MTEAGWTRGKEVEPAIDELKAQVQKIYNAGYQQGRVAGLREAEKYALRCLKELQDKIRDLESGKCVLAGAQTKEGVEAWVHAKTLEASRIAKWITARIIEQQAQGEKGVWE